MVYFAGSSGKQVIRCKWDLPIISKVSGSILKEPLNYFGLPGPLIEDLLDWKDFIAQTTAVEKQGSFDVIHDLKLNIMRYGFAQRGFQLLLGDIDDVLLTGRDSINQQPQCEWYHLINLDYCGGWLYKGKSGKSKRIEALGALFELQKHKALQLWRREPGRKCSFLLFLTINVRSNDRGEIPQYTKKYIAKIVDDKKLAEAIRCIPEEGHEHWFLKFYVTHNVIEMAKARQLTAYVWPPVYYGTRPSYLVHFAFYFSFKAGQDAIAVPYQLHSTIMRLPLLTIGKDEIELLPPPAMLGEHLEAYNGLQSYIDEFIQYHETEEL